jgi:Family of unknown function (DUF6152)
MQIFNKAKSALAITTLLTSGSAFAHHSQALFDMSKCQTLEGTVRTFEYQFPHSWLWVVVPNAKGSEDVWGFESASPSQMIEVEPRWKKDVVKKGDKVKVKFSPLRDGRTGGAMATLTLPDGTTLRAATPACNTELGPPIPNAVPSSKDAKAK